MLYNKNINIIDRLSSMPRKYLAAFCATALLLAPACKKNIELEIGKHLSTENTECYEEKDFLRYLLIHRMQGYLLYHEDNKELLDSLLSDKDLVYKIYLNHNLSQDYSFYLSDRSRNKAWRGPQNIIRARDYKISKKLSKFPVLGNASYSRDQAVRIIEAIEKYLNNHALTKEDQYYIDNVESLWFYNGNFLNNQTHFILRDLLLSNISETKLKTYKNIYLGEYYDDPYIEDHNNLADIGVEIEELFSEFLKKRTLDKLTVEHLKQEKMRKAILVLGSLLSMLSGVLAYRFYGMHQRKKLYQEIMELNSKIIKCEIHIKKLEKASPLDTVLLEQKNKELLCHMKKLSKSFEKYKGAKQRNFRLDNVNDHKSEILEPLATMLGKAQEIYITDAHVWDRSDGEMLNDFIQLLIARGLKKIHLLLGAPRPGNPAGQKSFQANIVLLQQYAQVDIQVVETELFHDREIETELGYLHLGRSLSELKKIKPGRINQFSTSYIPKLKPMKSDFQPQSAYIQLLLEEARLYGTP